MNQDNQVTEAEATPITPPLGSENPYQGPVGVDDDFDLQAEAQKAQKAEPSN